MKIIQMQIIPIVTICDGIVLKDIYLKKSMCKA